MRGERKATVKCMAGHSNTTTTGLYTRRADDISVGEVEWVGT
jgi:hypothetical protein